MTASKPKKPKKTGEEVAAQRRQTVALDRETEEEERRLRALSRGRLGASSLLSGISGGPSGGSGSINANTRPSGSPVPSAPGRRDRGSLRPRER